MIASIAGYCLYKTSELILLIGATIDVIPNTRVKLKIFDPTMFPKANPLSFFNTAMIDVASSGKDVPTEPSSVL